jgi:hypothetical protein
MRIALSIILLFAVALAGCVVKKTAPPRAMAQPRAGTPAPGASATNQTLIVTSEDALMGKVALVNPTARFVVLNFPLGKMAAAEQRLSLYRRGLKVGEVKVTGPIRENNIVADLVAGDAEVGDEARSH